MNSGLRNIILTFIVLFSFSWASFSQIRDPKPIQLFAKGGIAAGGSKAANFTSGNSSLLLFSPSFGGGIAFAISPSFQLVVEALYIKKGVNCRMEYNQHLEDAYNLSVTSPDEVERAVSNNVPLGIIWSKNSYIEIPFTLSYTYCEGLFRTRIGGYYAYAIHRGGEFMIIENGKESIRDLETSLIRKYVKRRDMGIKIINEFFLDNISFSLEFSGGLNAVINPRNPNSNRRSYNMAVSAYLNLYF